MSRRNLVSLFQSRSLALILIVSLLIVSQSACLGNSEVHFLSAEETADRKTVKTEEATESGPRPSGKSTTVSESASSRNTSQENKESKNKKTSESTSGVKEDRKGWPELREIYDRFQKEGKNTPQQQPVSRLVVYLKEQFVAAFRDVDGKSEVLRVFPCSSGHINGHTPIGTFSLGMKTVESWLFDNALAQYGAQITGNILFHSLPSYDGSLNSGLKLSDLNAMGQPASHGCVRLFCMDAKWIYENCPSGTVIEVVAERRSHEMHLPAAVHYLRLKDGAPAWDPSDPDPNNPYHDFAVLEKWAVAKPWLKPFTVVPPVWPQFVENPAPVVQETGEAASEVSNGEEVENTAAESSQNADDDSEREVSHYDMRTTEKETEKKEDVVRPIDTVQEKSNPLP